MRKNTFIILLCAILTHVSCKKDTVEIMPLANITIVNAVLDGNVLKVNNFLRDSVLGYNARNFSVKTGNQQFYMFPAGDSLNPFFKGVFTLDAGNIYSMYLSGMSKAPDTLWVKENNMPYYNDSTIGVRFINLSTDSGPLSFTLASDPGTNLHTNLLYRGITGMVKLPLSAVVIASTVTFQVRDANKKVLASYVLPARASRVYQNISIQNSRNRNITLVVAGLQGTTSAVNKISLFPVKNY